MKKITVLKGKTVYLFGGSSGIGLEMAKQMAAEGAHVMVYARTEINLDKALAEIKKVRLTASVRVEKMPVDVTDREGIRTVIEESIRNFGVPDILINCAGRAYPATFEDISYEQFDETMRVNLYGIWNTCAAALPYMKKSGGWILNTSSMAGFLGVYGYTDYAASKYAIVGFSEALRSEIESAGIGVSVLCPPDTDTPGFETENQTKPPETRAICGGAKIMTPADVARICIKELKQGKKMIIPGFDGKLTYFLKSHFPFIVELLIKRLIKKSSHNP
ncbi:MAG: SDR family oxidoreductase [Spirochaetales bacterium]|nr:SDR family oxidoreductase [Spirochaetales bacterium]